MTDEWELESGGGDIVPALMRSLKEIREEKAKLAKREEKVRATLLPLLEAEGGKYTDEVSGLTARVIDQPRWEYDAQALLRLVTEGLLKGDEYADAIVSSVDKDVVQSWVDRGLIQQRHLAQCDARRQTKAVTIIEITERKS